MRRTLTLARRELSAYFLSPMGYVLGGLFLLVVSVIFLLGLPLPMKSLEPVFRGGGESSLGDLFTILAGVMVVVVPLLTMRLVSEELRSGTIETLMTAPVTDTEVILGKFLGTMGMYAALLATTLVYFVLLAVYGKPDWGVAATGYLGMILLGATYVAVGVFASTLTHYQVVAGLIGIAVLGFFTLGVFLVSLLASMVFRPEVVKAVGQLNMIGYLSDFSMGFLDTRSVVYFVTVTAFFLFLSVKVLESRRWR